MPTKSVKCLNIVYEPFNEKGRKTFISESMDWNLQNYGSSFRNDFWVFWFGSKVINLISLIKNGLCCAFMQACLYCNIQGTVDFISN